MRLEDLGLIGNCQFSALVERTGAIVWCCLPRFDSEPVFSTLLDARTAGSSMVGPAGGERGVQRYLENTNVLETTFETASGTVPRARLRAALRAVRPRVPADADLSASSSRSAARRASACAASRGSAGRSGRRAQTMGSNHVRFEGFATQLRLTTDVPLSYLAGQPFALTERRHLVLTWGAPVEEPLAAALRPLPAADPSLLAALGEALRRPARSSSRR